MKITAAVLVLYALSFGILNAQKQPKKPTIEVESVPLQIGMTKAQVAEKFVGRSITKHEATTTG